MEGNLKENGWFLSSEGITECKKACMKENPSTSECLKAAANLDLKVYGTKFLPEDINKRKIDSIKGPGVLQIQKLRNVSAPRSNEESSHAPRLLKFQLTDGPSSCQGLEYATISNLSLSTPPGTKICLVGSVPVRNGMLLLDDENTKVIGGEVESLVNRWKLNKSLAKHSRATASNEGGPPPFVPFSHGNHGRSRDDSRGKGNYDDVTNGHEEQGDKRRHDRYRQDNPPRRGRDNQDNFDRGSRPRGGDSFRGRGNQDRRNDNRSYQRDDRGNRDSRRGNRSFEPGMQTNGGDRYNQRRTDHNRTDKSTKPINKPSDTGIDSPANRSRSGSGIRENGTSDVTSHDDEASSRPADGSARGGRGGTRGGRGGRREPMGGGRSNSLDQDESDEYRVRQPSDKGTLWDYVNRKLTIKTPPKPSTPTPTEKESKETEEQDELEYTTDQITSEHQTATATTTTTVIANTAATEITPKDDEQQAKTPPPPPPPPQPQASQQQQTIERTSERQDKRTRPDTRPANQLPREQQKTHIKSTDHRGKHQERTARHQDSFSGSSRDHKQRSYPQRQQHAAGQGRGRGPRGKHDEGRSYNQSLPPRLQKKQQQQYHQQHHHQQQQQHFMSLDRDTRDKSSSPGSGSSSDTRLSQSPSVESNQSPQSRNSDDSGQQRHHQQRRQKNYPRQQQQQQQPRQQIELEQQQAKQSQYDAQTVQSTYLSTQQPTYQVEQQQLYEHHETGPMIQQEYNYQQPPHPPPQQYPVYQMQTQMGPPQAVMVTQPITSPSQQHMRTPITTAQIRWKKGNQCLALRRDGQYYSAKIEHVTPDGQQCMVSFQDFHGGCEMTSITSLRPFPIIAWTEPSAQSLPATTMTPVPIYAQPAQVAMVPRPQVMVPVQAQPQAYIGPKGPIASPSSVHPPQGLSQPPPGLMQWQPAPVSYHELRAQPAYQPAMIHYDPMMQTSGGVRQAYYPMPPAGTAHFVRGIKELHGQDLYAHQAAGPLTESTADSTKLQPTGNVYYNVRPKKPNTSRPSQAV